MTSAASTLEAVLKVYVEVRSIEIKGKPVLRDLWRAVSRDLFDQPMPKEEQDIMKVMSGFRSVIDGLAGIRDKASSAHGRGLRPYKLEPRHAYMAIGAAETFCGFIVDTWLARREPLPPKLTGSKAERGDGSPRRAQLRLPTGNLRANGAS